MQFVTTPCLGAADKGNGGYSSQGTPTSTLDRYPVLWVGWWVSLSDFVSLLTQAPQQASRVRSNAGWEGVRPLPALVASPAP